MASYDGDEDSGRRRPSQHRPSGGGSGDLASSAKLVAEAAKLALQDHSLEKVDKGRVAGAAADLLHAASQYGKLEGKPVGGYLEKAEEYLHQYGRKDGAGGKHQGDGEGKYGKKATRRSQAAVAMEEENTRMKMTTGRNQAVVAMVGEGTRMKMITRRNPQVVAMVVGGMNKKIITRSLQVAALVTGGMSRKMNTRGL